MGLEEAILGEKEAVSESVKAVLRNALSVLETHITGLNKQRGLSASQEPPSGQTEMGLNKFTVKSVLAGESMSSSGWIGVDLDGTLATYAGWVGPDHIGEPIAPMVERVKNWLVNGKTVKIFTARMHGHGMALIGGGVEDVKTPIEQWCLRHIGQVLEVTNAKDFGMIELWDDRCVQVEANTGIPVASCKDRKRKSYQSPSVPESNARRVRFLYLQTLLPFWSNEPSKQKRN